jgi:hypothetical protein
LRADELRTIAGYAIALFLIVKHLPHKFGSVVYVGICPNLLFGTNILVRLNWNEVVVH